MPRFVLLYHECPSEYVRPSHWDLMFEYGDVLRTWALERLPRRWLPAYAHTLAKYPRCPSPVPDDEVVATELGDHRCEYLEFEGPLSGNRGSVVRVVAGTYEREEESANLWQASLTLGDFSGRLEISRSKPECKEWILTLRAN